jgi:hypothetical protein
MTNLESEAQKIAIKLSLAIEHLYVAEISFNRKRIVKEEIQRALIKFYESYWLNKYEVNKGLIETETKQT